MVILLCDDLGYGDLGCYGHPVIRTPNIDRMAAEGARLTEFYATATCTPSRAALLTGRYPLRSGLTRVLIPREQFGIPDSEITLAEALKTRGYRTGCIGKWHLGDRLRHRPTRHGFDSFYGVLYSNDMTLPVVKWPPIRLYRGERPIESPVKQSTLTQRFTQEALEFIDTSGGRPFFLYLAYTMPHLPWSASEAFAGKSAYGPYGDAVEELDWSVGQVLGRLARRGLDRNTIAVLASDNGPARVTRRPGGSTGGLRGGKASCWEGGVRVPCIVRWPARVPAGAVRPGIASIMDLFATATEAAGAQLPPGHVLDGVGLEAFLAGRADSPRTTLCHFHKGRLFALREGEWKLHLLKVERGKNGRWKAPVACNPPELYNLKRDPGEEQNLYFDYKDAAARLTRLADESRAAIEPGRLPPSPVRDLLPLRKKK